MNPEEQAIGLAAQQDRRSNPRHGVDEDALLLVLKHGATLPCRVVDLSLGGCRLHSRERFLGGALARVEVCFKVRGLAFRFSGITQWTDGRNQLGVRFVEAPSRRLRELAEIIGEVQHLNAARAEREAAEEQTRRETAPAARQAEAPGPPAFDAIVPLTLPPPERPAALIPKAEVSTTPAPRPVRRERRAQPRQEVDTTAVIHLIKIASRLHGRIQDLSVGGCRIRTDERFPVGIYTRAEVEFRLEGLPFRLGGVIQAIHHRQMVGIRFLDVSERKRAQVEQLMEEILEARSGQKAEAAGEDPPRRASA